MKNIYTTFFNLFTTLKVICPLIAFLYCFMWFVTFFNPPFTEFLIIPFEPLAEVIRSVYKLEVSFEDKKFEITYIIATVVLIIFHHIFGLLANLVVKLYKFDEMRQIWLRSNEEKRVNHTLSRDFQHELTHYTKYAILFNLTLKQGYDVRANSKAELDALRKDFYAKLLYSITKKYSDTKGVSTNKLFLVMNDFETFDTMLLEFLQVIKNFINENAKKDIVSEFSISIEALKEDSSVTKALELLEKIDSFNFKNKVAVTSAFKIKYENSKELSKFRTIPLGVSRFFKEEDEFEDFELYNLKFNKEDKK